MNCLQVTTPEAALSYVSQRRAVLGLPLEEASRLSATELSDGQINYVFKICAHPLHGDAADCKPPAVAHVDARLARRCLVLKHAPPYVKSLGEGVFPLDQARLAVEAAALHRVHASCPQHAPELLLHDESPFVLVQEYLGPPDLPEHIKLSEAIHRQEALVGLSLR